MKRAFAGAFSLDLLEPDSACWSQPKMGAGLYLVAEAADGSKEITRERGLG